MSTVESLFGDVLAAPDRAERWHALAVHLNLHEPVQREAMLARLEAAAPTDGPAAFLRASFLMLHRADWASVCAARAALAPEPALRSEQVNILQLLMPGYLLSLARSHSHALVMLEQAGWPALLHDEAQALIERLEAPASAHAAAGPLRRVAVVAPWLGAAHHPPTRLALDHVKLLRGAGLEVAIFSPEETRAADLGRHCGAPLFNGAGPVEPAAWRTDPPGALPWSADIARPIDERRLELVRRLDEFAPDAVLHVGLPSSLLGIVAARHPVLALPSVGLPPLGPADAWLCSTPSSPLAQRVAAEGVTRPVAYAWRASGTANLLRMPARPRAELGADGKTLLIVTVGGRLVDEIGGPWADAMIELLRTTPRVRWVLVGGAMPPTLAAIADRLCVLPRLPETALIATIKACDVMVNPPRLGGGIGVARAMACGLPVVSRDDCDGGDKLGALAAASDAEYFARLRALLADKDARRALGRRAKERHDAELELACALPALLAALDSARERFTARRAESAA